MNEQGSADDYYRALRADNALGKPCGVPQVKYDEFARLQQNIKQNECPEAYIFKHNGKSYFRCIVFG